MTDDEHAEVDEAIETLHDAACDDVDDDDAPSSWAPLRGPLYMVGGSLLLLCVSVVILAAMVLRADYESADEQKQDRCVQRFQVRAEEAASEARSQTSILIAAVGRELLDETNGDTLAVLQPVLSDLQAANRADQEAVEARESWTDAGQPLPCPIGPGGGGG